MLRFLTAGESHGPGLTVITEGLPAGLFIEKSEIDKHLKRRQGGYGRSERMKIERDEVEITGGVRCKKTLGSPVSVLIRNRDWRNWSKKWDSTEPLLSPRPGHADLAGVMKYGFSDIRDVLERSSARETAVRCVVGALAKIFLKCFGIDILGYVLQIGKTKTESRPKSLDEIEGSLFFCADRTKEEEMVKEIERARERGDSVGGVFEVRATGVPAGLGSYVHWDRRLDGRLAQAMMSIPAVKGVEIGAGFEMASMPGSKASDQIFYKKRFYRKTNNAGGIEGGVSNGEPIVIRAAVKPIPTLKKPLSSVNIRTKEETTAVVERSDICAVPAASVIGESMAAYVIADLFMERFGCDNMEQIKRRFFSEQAL
jgi:chorismate synthase